MKKIMILLPSMLLASRVFGAQTVTCNTNGVLQWPTNFCIANGISSTGSVATLQSEVTVLQVQTVSLSNQLVSSTGATASVSARVSILETNTATAVQGIAATNALTQVTNLAASAVTQSAGSITLTGTVTAAHFAGNGAGLTGVVSAVTGGVNQISVAGSNLTGNITLAGTGLVNSGGNTVTVQRVAYITKNIVPTTNTWDFTMEGPRDENFTLQKIWAKTDLYTCTFSLLTLSTNGLWRSTPSTLISGIVAPTTGMMIVTNIVIPSNTTWGIQITDYDPRCQNIIVTYKGVY